MNRLNTQTSMKNGPVKHHFRPSAFCRAFNIWRATLNTPKKWSLLIPFLSLPTAFYNPAFAAPSGGQVVSGQATIANEAALTTINQSTHQVAIDWQTFNIGHGETVNFVQPDASSIALNRIFDQNASQIFGNLNANGKVFLTNSNGILFGETAQVNVGSLVASGLNIGLEDFNAGNHLFTNEEGIPGGAVVNYGLIEASIGGSVNLIGTTVDNQGMIIAQYGQVNLASGKSAVIDFDGDELIQFKIDENIIENALGIESAVNNSGTIQADGGRVLLQGNTAKDVFSRSVNNNGIIKAGRIENVGGEIRLVGTDTVIHSGVIDVDGIGENSTGGDVQILGNKTGLFEAAEIHASGDAGGGEVLIGGDFQGKNPDIQNSEFTFVSEGSSIDADALVNGDGGKVIVWADDSTRYYGEISARGGEVSGDGGFVETSGKQYLDAFGSVDIGAETGVGGTWLLDPVNVTIVSGSTNTTNTGTSPFTPTGTGSQIGVDNINTALNVDGASVIITTDDGGTLTESGDVTLNSGANILKNAGAASTLTINAAGTIKLDGTITSTSNQLNLVLNANDNSGTQNDPILAVGNVEINAAVTTNGGTFESSGVGFDNNVSAVGTITTNGGSVTLNHTGSVRLDAEIDAGAGNIDITGTEVLGAGNINELTTTGTVSLTSTTDDIGGGGAGQEIKIAGSSDLTVDTEDDFWIAMETGIELSNLDITIAPGTGGGENYVLTSNTLTLTLNDSASNATVALDNSASSTALNFGLTNKDGGIEVTSAGLVNSTGSITLTSDGAVTDTGAISATTLSLQSASVANTGTFTLNNALNNVATLTAGDTNDLSSLSYTDADAFNIGASGLTATGNITLTSDGTVDGSGAAITANTLILENSTADSGIFTLTGNNNVNIIRGGSGFDIASLNYNDLGDLTIGSTTNGLHASGSILLNAVGDLTQASTNNIIAEDLNLTAVGGDITINPVVNTLDVNNVNNLTLVGGTIGQSTLNSGTLNIAGNVIFSNGLTYIGSTTLNANMTATTGNIDLNTTTVNSDSVLIASGNIDLGATTINGTNTLSLGGIGGTSSAITIGTVSGPSAGLSIDTSTTADISGSLAVNHLTIEGGGTATVANGISISGTTTLDGALVTTANDIDLTTVVANGGSNVSLNSSAGGGNISITGTLTGSGTENLVLDAANASIVINGAITAVDTVTMTANTANLQAVTSSGAQDYSAVATTTLNGSLNTSDDAISLDDVIIATSLTVDPGAASLTTGSITVNSGNTLSIGDSAAWSSDGDLTIQTGSALQTVSAGNTSVTFNGNASQSITSNGSAFNTISLEKTGDTITFLDDITTTSLSTTANLFNVQFDEDISVTDAVVFNNTGSVSFGDGSDADNVANPDIALFDNGITHIAGTTVVNGNLITTSDIMTLASVSLTGNSLFDTDGGALSAGSITGNTGAESLILDADTSSIDTGAISNINLVTMTANTANLQAVTTSGAQDYTNVSSTTLNGTLTVSNAGNGIAAGDVTLATGSGAFTLTGNDAGNDVTLGSVEGTQALVITAIGGDVSLGAVGSGFALTTTSITANTANLQAVSSSGAQDYSAVATTTLNGSLNTTNNAISFDDVIIATSLTVDPGAASLTTSSITVNSGNTLSIGDSATWSSDGNLAIQSGSALQTVSAGNASVTFNGNASQSITSNGSAFENIILDKTGDTITFLDDITTTNLSVTANAFNIQFDEDISVSDAVIFANTGSVSFGDGSDADNVANPDIALFDNGMTHIAGTTVVNGNLLTTSDIMTLASVSLTGNSLFDTDGAALTTGAITGSGSENLVLNAAGSSIDINGAISGVDTVTMTANTADLQAVATSGAQDYTNVTTTTLNSTLMVDTAGSGIAAGDVTLEAGSGVLTLTGDNAGNDITLGAVNGTQALTIMAIGGDVTLGAIGSINRLTSTNITANTADLQAVTTSGTQDYDAVSSTTLNDDLSTSNASIQLSDVILANGATVKLDAGSAVTQFNNASLQTGSELILGSGANGNFNINEDITKLIGGSNTTLTIDVGTGNNVNIGRDLNVDILNNLSGDLNITGDTSLGFATLNGDIISNSNISFNSVTVLGNSILDSGSSNILLGDITINPNQSLSLGKGTMTGQVTTGPVSGGLNSTLEINTADTAPVALITGTVAVDQLIITQSGGVTFSDSVTTSLIDIIDTLDGGDIAFNGNVSTTDITVAAAGYNISFNGSNNAIANNTSFNNQGMVALGNDSSDIINFIGGLDTTSAGSTMIAGSVITTDNAMDLGNFTLAADSFLSSGTGVISLASVSDGADAFSLTLGDASQTGTITLNDNANIGALNTANGAYNIALLGSSNTVDSDTTFTNTGLITLGDQASDTNLFIGGLNTTSGSGTVLAGSLLTTDTQIDLGNLTLASNSSITSGSANINLASVTDGANAYSLALGDTNQTGAITLNGNASFNSLISAASAYDIALLGSNNELTTNTEFTNTGRLILGDSANGSDTFLFSNGLRHTAGSTVLGGSISAPLGGINLNNTITIQEDTSLNAGAAQISLGNISLDPGANTSNIHNFSAETTGKIVLAGNVGTSGDINLNGSVPSGFLETNSALPTTVISSSAGSVNLGNITTGNNLEISAETGIRVNNLGSNTDLFGSISLNNDGTGLINFDGNLYASDISLTNLMGSLNVSPSRIIQSNGAITINATDIDLEGQLIANNISITASDNRPLLIESGGLYSGTDSFILDQAELNRLTIDEGGLLSLFAEDLIFFGGTLSVFTSSSTTNTNIASNIFAQTSASDDSGKIFIGTTPLTNPGDFFDSAFNGTNPLKTGNLRLDNLSVSSDDVYIFGSIITEQDLTLNANRALFLTDSPFEATLSGVTSTPISNLETIGTLTLSADQVVRLSGDLKLKSTGALDLSNFDIISAGSRSTHINITAGNNIQLGNIGSDSAPVSSLTVNHATGILNLTGDIYTTPATTSSNSGFEADGIDFTGSPGITSSGHVVMSAESNPIKITKINSINNSLTENGFLEIMSNTGNIEIASINSTSGALSLSSNNGSIIYSSPILKVPNLTINGDFQSTNADTGLQIFADTGNYGGLMTVTGPTLDLFGKPNTEINIIDSILFTAPTMLLSNTIIANADSFSQPIDIDLSGITTLTVKGNASITADNGTISLSQSDDQFAIDSNGSSKLVLSTNPLGSVELGPISTLSTLEVNTGSLELFGDISTKSNLQLEAQAINNDFFLPLNFTSAKVNMAGTFSENINGKYDVFVSQNLNSLGDLNLSNVNLNSAVDSLQLNISTYDSSLNTSTNDNNSITLGTVISPSISITGNATLAGNITTTGDALAGPAGLTLNNANIELADNVIVNSSIEGVGGAINLTNTNIETHGSNLSLEATAINMDTNSTIESHGGNISISSQAGNTIIGLVSASTSLDGTIAAGNIKLNSSGGLISAFPPLNDLNEAVNQVNVVGADLIINSSSIGKGIIEPIVVDLRNSLTLNFSSEYAYIINLNNVPISSSKPVVDVIRDRFRSSDKALSTSIYAFNQGIDYEPIFGSSESLYDIEGPSSEDIVVNSQGDFSISSLVPKVPSLMRTMDGWKFERANFIVEQTEEPESEEPEFAPKQEQKKQNKKRVEWLLDGFKYRSAP
jgi:filamentous hemagglutinin family protein